MSRAADDDLFDLPLFPLQTVLFPGGSLALKIFEPRYLDMIASCLRERSPFGVVAIKHGSEVGAAETFDVGTAADIVDWSQERGGLLGLTAVGRRRFALTGRQRRGDGLYVGRAAWLAQAGGRSKLPERFSPLVELLRRLAIVNAEEAAFDDAEWLGFRLAEALPLAIGIKQPLLEIADPLERLERLAAILRGGGGRAE